MMEIMPHVLQCAFLYLSYLQSVHNDLSIKAVFWLLMLCFFIRTEIAQNREKDEKSVLLHVQT